jgi:hypothetical protein
MDWREVYQAPFRHTGLLYVYSNNHTMSLNFFGNDENFINNVVNKLNGDSSVKFDDKFTIKNNVDFYYDEVLKLRVRGWGALIGRGGFHLTVDEATKIQTDFANWILETLNN